MPNIHQLLLVKTSSLGDVLHNLPVVSDIRFHLPHAQIDWVVEDSFADLPALHPEIRQVITVSMRRWRKSWWAARHEIRATCSSIANTSYDLAIDTQGLLKSAAITRCARTLRFGYDRHSAREPLASLFYDRTICVTKGLHAVERNRQLAAAALGYELQGVADYGIHTPSLTLPWLPDFPYVTLLHATSRDDKLWGEDNWISLGKRIHQAGFRSVLTWGNEKERDRAARLHTVLPDSVLAPRLNLKEAATLLGHSRAVIGVDTGLSHLAAALGVPTIGIYVATDPKLTGLYAGKNAINLGGEKHPPSVDEVLMTLAQLGFYA